MNEDLDYIKRFSKITISNACRKAKVKTNNLYTGQVNKDKIKKVRKILESNIAKLYLYEGDADGKTNNTL